MACYSPLCAWEGKPTESGKIATVWRRSDSPEQKVRPIPCNRCIGCRLRYAKHWATRCMHESDMHTFNSFVTLTFDDRRLPADYDGDVHVRDVQLFMKRLRQEVKQEVRYFFAGEYGGQFGRPHYHGLLFGYDFPDKALASERFGNRVFTSDSLSRLWPFGFHSIGDVSYASACYVARYCLKKVGGEFEYFRDGQTNERMQVDKKSGLTRVAEFTVMSRGCKARGTGGIGKSWFDRYSSDVYPSDEVIVNGKQDKPPRFYDNLLDRIDPDLLESLKRERAYAVKWSESTLDRLRVKEEVRLAKMSTLLRPLGGDNV